MYLHGSPVHGAYCFVFGGLTVAVEGVEIIGGIVSQVLAGLALKAAL
jgi:hypothetical protein